MEIPKDDIRERLHFLLTQAGLRPDALSLRRHWISADCTCCQSRSLRVRFSPQGGLRYSCENACPQFRLDKSLKGVRAAIADHPGMVDQQLHVNAQEYGREQRSQPIAPRASTLPPHPSQSPSLPPAPATPVPETPPTVAMPQAGRDPRYCQELCMTLLFRRQVS